MVLGKADLLSSLLILQYSNKFKLDLYIKELRILHFQTFILTFENPKVDIVLPFTFVKRTKIYICIIFSVYMVLGRVDLFIKFAIFTVQ